MQSQKLRNSRTEPEANISLFESKFATTTDLPIFTTKQEPHYILCLQTCEYSGILYCTRANGRYS